MKRSSKVRFLTMALLGALALGAWGCGGGGGGGSAPAVETAAITGTVARGAAKVAAGALAKVPNTVNLVVVAVNETGAVAASQVLGAGTDFALDVPVGHDYLILFRQDNATGPLLATLAVDSTRNAFSVKAGAVDVSLGEVDVDLFRGVATASAAGLATTLPVPTSVAGAGIFLVSTKPTDSDGDQLPDGFEIASALDPRVNDPGALTRDTDGDGLTDVQEAKLGTNPKNTDSDGDGIADGVEDANRNGVVDATETNPALADTDTDGMPDGFEVAGGLNPKSAADATADADLDGLSNVAEFQKGTDVKKADTDGDGLGDGAEVTLSTDPLKADTDADGVGDGPDGFPLNAARFAAYQPAALLRLAGAKFSSASAINDIDQVVGTSDNTAGVVNAVMWDVHTGLPPFNPIQLGGLAAGKYSAAFGINNLSEVVGEAVNAGDLFMPVIWSVAGTQAAPPTALQLLPGDTEGAAYAINALGQMVGESRNPAGRTTAVFWSSETAAPKPLPDLAGTGNFSAAYFINDKGQIAGEATDTPNGARHATLWTVDAANNVTGTQDLGAPAGHGPSVAYGVNELGEVVGESIHLDTPDPHSVTWIVAAGAVTIVHLGTAGTPSNTLAVNSRGRLAGWSGTAAVVWEPKFTNPTASAVAADSALLGAVANPAGSTKAFGINVKGTVVGMFQANGAAGDQAFVAVAAAQVVP